MSFWLQLETLRFAQTGGAGEQSSGFGCILQVAAAIKETDVLFQFLKTSNSFVISWRTEG